MNPRAAMKILKLNQLKIDIQKEIKILERDVSCVQFTPARNVLINMLNTKVFRIRNINNKIDDIKRYHRILEDNIKVVLEEKKWSANIVTLY